MSPEAYRLAHMAVYNSYPAWKCRAIDEDRAAGNWDSSVMVEFSKAVVKRAEAIARPDQSKSVRPFKPKKCYSYDFPKDKR